MGKQFKIKPISLKKLKKIASDIDTVWGYFDEMADTIYIAKALKGTKYERVLLHEITHAVLSITGLSNLLKSKLEEAICDSMENLVTLK